MPCYVLSFVIPHTHPPTRHGVRTPDNTCAYSSVLVFEQCDLRFTFLSQYTHPALLPRLKKRLTPPVVCGRNSDVSLL